MLPSTGNASDGLSTSRYLMRNSTPARPLAHGKNFWNNWYDSKCMKRYHMGSAGVQSDRQCGCLQLVADASNQPLLLTILQSYLREQNTDSQLRRPAPGENLAQLRCSQVSIFDTCATSDTLFVASRGCKRKCEPHILQVKTHSRQFLAYTSALKGRPDCLNLSL